MLQIQLDADSILGLNGIGPKTMQEIDAELANLSFPEAPVEVEGEVLAPQEVEAVEELAQPVMEIPAEIVMAEPAEA